MACSHSWSIRGTAAHDGVDGDWAFVIGRMRGSAKSIRARAVELLLSFQDVTAVKPPRNPMTTLVNLFWRRRNSRLYCRPPVPATGPSYPGFEKKIESMTCRYIPVGARWDSMTARKIATRNRVAGVDVGGEALASSGGWIKRGAHIP